jgi:hypothetical protein
MELLKVVHFIAKLVDLPHAGTLFNHDMKLMSMKKFYDTGIEFITPHFLRNLKVDPRS